jgi:hypothetical protein
MKYWEGVSESFFGSWVLCVNGWKMGGGLLKFSPIFSWVILCFKWVVCIFFVEMKLPIIFELIMSLLEKKRSRFNFLSSSYPLTFAEEEKKWV